MIYKLQQSVFFILMLTQVLFTSCSKSTTAEEPASLKIHVTKQGGIAVSGATVNLFQILYNASNPPFSTLVTDVNGDVTFTGLPATSYYVSGKKDCLVGPLIFIGVIRVEEGSHKQASLFLEESAILKLTNTSSETYNLSGIPGTTARESIPANSIQLYYPGIGAATIHGEPVSTPGIGRDTAVNFVCGDTVRITYPF